MNRLTVALIVGPIAAVAGTVIGLSTLDGEHAATAAAAPVTDERLGLTHATCLDYFTGADEYLTLADGGQTLLVDTNPTDYEYGDAPGALICVLRELQTPQSIVSRVERTTAMQGVQDGEHDGIAYSWTYHPDNGTEITITYEED
jgi:hypothetical protein